MIHRVWDCARACPGSSGVAVATDDVRIAEHVQSFGLAIMTADHHPSGTDRCHEAYIRSGFQADIVVNIQGDEPFIKPEQVLALVEMFQDPQVQIATLKKEIYDAADIDNPNVVKVVCDNRGRALYFSRSRVPYMREGHDHLRYFRHIGMYAYRASVLADITGLKPTVLEETEKLEQLRWLENGYHIAVAETQWQSPAVDTPADLEAAIAFMMQA